MSSVFELQLKGHSKVSLISRRSSIGGKGFRRNRHHGDGRFWRFGPDALRVQIT